MPLLRHRGHCPIQGLVAVHTLLGTWSASGLERPGIFSAGLWVLVTGRAPDPPAVPQQAPPAQGLFWNRGQASQRAGSLVNWGYVHGAMTPPACWGGQ